MNFQQVNPNIMFGGFILLIIGAAIGEYLHVVLPGTASVLLGALTGGGVYHIATTQTSKIVANSGIDTSGAPPQIQEGHPGNA